MTTGVRLFTLLPTAVARKLASAAGDMGLHDSVVPKDYPAIVAER